MQEKSLKPGLEELVGEVSRNLSAWEAGVERTKKRPSVYVETIGWKGMGAILQYNAAIRIASLGAQLLGSSLKNRQDGLLFGLTKRPMFESYTRGIWLEFVAKEEYAENFLFRSSGDEARAWKTLLSKRKSPSLDRMWNDLNKQNIMRTTVSWMRGKKDWWNDSVHMAARSVWMGWSNEYGAVIHNNEQIRNDLIALLEIGAQCAGHVHTLNEGRRESEKAQRIHKEKQRLRTLVEVGLR